ncbi:MFS transporter [Microbacterium pseudoresistens]|uniref:MFS family permease n=1 Tax=Microbacterium pseudoresistens TaxID=640634 RepID=A0A7Y9JM60_9MICO|nr:MFS transporter [Microbacterium pseudoresistens]NYD53691.1 MFS family permease [Microbacterium pseudoresistens]
MLAVLRNRIYRRLFTAHCVGLIGTGILTVALGLLAYDIAGGDAGAILGVAMMVKMVAYVFLTPVLSALTSRFRSKQVLVFADVLRAATALLLPFVTEAWQIYVLIFVLQSASALFTPALQALIPDVVPDETQYTYALAMTRLSYDAESLVSPMIAAALLVVMDFNLLFLGTTVGFVVSALIIVRTAVPEHGGMLVRSFRRRLLEGVLAFVQRRELRGLLGLNLALSASTSVVVVTTVLVVKDDLGGGSSDVALLLACFGTGSLTTALIAPRLVRRWPDYSVMFFCVAPMPVVLLSVGASLIFVPVGTLHWLVPCLWVLFGLFTSAVVTLSGRLLRRFSTEGSRNAIFSGYFSLSHGFLLVMYPSVGALSARFGVGPTAIVLSVVSLAGVLTCLAIWRTLLVRRQ